MANVLALVSFKIFPAEMGGQKGVAEFYRYLAPHHKIVMALSANNENVDTGYATFPILHHNRRMFLNLFKIRSLERIVKEHAIDCIIAEHSFTGWLAKRLSKRTGIPFIIHNHNIEHLRFRQMGRRWWRLYAHHEKRIFRDAHHLLFISQEDLRYAEQNMHIAPGKSTVVTYGIDKVQSYLHCKTELAHRLGIDAEDKILYFNGTLDYQPNRDAVQSLLRKILPQIDGFDVSYRLVISGRRCPADLRREMADHPRVMFLDYVEPLHLFYSGADVFLNPVVNDSGVKTKLIEALAHSACVVSTESGAKGLRQDLAGKNLILAKDYDTGEFALKVFDAMFRDKQPVSAKFLEYYSWEHQAANASAVIKKLVRSS